MSYKAWYAIPSAKEPGLSAPFFDKWKDMGYGLAIQRDPGQQQVKADYVLACDYRGTAHSHNQLAKHVFENHPDTEFVVFGGDDMTPDPNKRADEIVQECLDHFHGTMGVMQPTGDRWGIDGTGLASSERICGSPFIGRDFAQRWNGGQGPCWPGYYHFYWDEEMREVTIGKYLWQRTDLIHYHDHWSRNSVPRPNYLTVAQQRWDRDQALFFERKAQRFSGHEPLLVAA